MAVKTCRMYDVCMFYVEGVYYKLDTLPVVPNIRTITQQAEIPLVVSTYSSFLFNPFQFPQTF